MGKVYQSSRFNIAAAAATDCNGGLFFDRDPLSDTPCLIEVKSYFGSQRYFTGGMNDGWRDSVQQSPLFGRGWAFQERLLGPRTLHFAGTQVYWQDKEIVASCTFSNGLQPGLLDEAILNPRPGNGDWLQTSYRVLLQYTTTRLTYPKDKLVALSGLARRFQEVYPEALRADDYLAGLWRPNIIHQLLWTVSREATLAPFYRAPSWSQAAVDGGISGLGSWWDNARADESHTLGCFHGRHEIEKTYNRLSSAVDVAVSSLDDEYALVSGGHITFSGPLFLAEVEPTTNSFEEHKLLLKGLKAQHSSSSVKLDLGPTRSTLVEGPCQTVFGRLICKPRLCATRSSALEKDLWAVDIEGLVFERAREEGAPAGLLTRTGVFKLGVMAEGSSDDVLHQLCVSSETLPVRFYENHDGESNYAYTIV